MSFFANTAPGFGSFGVGQTTGASTTANVGFQQAGAFPASSFTQGFPSSSPLGMSSQQPFSQPTFGQPSFDATKFGVPMQQPLQSPSQGSFATSSLPTFASPSPFSQQVNSLSQPRGWFSSTPSTQTTSLLATSTTMSQYQNFGSTKFRDLPETFRKELLNIEKYIRNERRKSSKLETQTNWQPLKETSERIEKAADCQKYGRESGVDHTVLQKRHKEKIDDMDTLGSLLESTTREDFLSLDRRNEEAIKKVMEVFMSYFKEIEDKIEDYEKNIEMRHLFYKSSGLRGQCIEDILKREYEYFIFLGSKLANVRERCRHLKEKFVKLLKLRNPQAVNPFENNRNQLDRIEDFSANMATSGFQQQSPGSTFSPATHQKPPLPSMEKRNLRNLGSSQDSWLTTPGTVQRRRDIENSSFKTPAPQITRFNSSFFP
eukprot:jgi/Galph1/3180/GphlegSOOS_G1841.1